MWSQTIPLGLGPAKVNNISVWIWMQVGPLLPRNIT